MKSYKISLLAICAQLALGNLCMMQTASAKEMPHETHMENTEMPHFSTNDIDVDCEHCSSHIEDAKEPMNPMDCSNGHCLMHAIPAESDTLQAPSLMIAISTEDTLPLSLFVTADLSTKMHSTAPPGLTTDTKTIVLIL